MTNLMRLYDRVEDLAGYCKEDVEELIGELLYIIDCVRSHRILTLQELKTIKDTEEWLNLECPE